MNNVDTEYFRLLNTVLNEGKPKKNRTGIDTIGVFGEQAKYNVDLNAFPILTTKKVWFKGIVHELLWFIKGDTNIKYLVDNDVHIWDEWAYKRYVGLFKKLKSSLENNATPLNQDNFIKGLKDGSVDIKLGELGEGTYGSMWRKFPSFVAGDGETYSTGNGYFSVTNNQIDWNTAYDICHVDQLQKVLYKLKTNPDDRRMIVSAWHPFWVDHCALPPCHCLFHFNTEELTQDERWNLIPIYNWCAEKNCHKDIFYKYDEHLDLCMDEIGVPRRRLNCLLYQRSCDLPLGVPFNITSYSLLTAMVAHCVNMLPGKFVHTYGDLHIYSNQIDGIKEQLKREPKALPKLWLNPEVKDLFNFKYEDIKLVDYNPHPKIEMPIAV